MRNFFLFRYQFLFLFFLLCFKLVDPAMDGAGDGERTRQILATISGALVAPRHGRAAGDADETLCALRDISSRSGVREPMALPADLGYEDSCRKVVEEVASAYGGRIDILINAAQEHEQGSITETTEADLDRVFCTNIFYFLTLKHAVARMAHGGCVVNTASVVAYKKQDDFGTCEGLSGATVPMVDYLDDCVPRGVSRRRPHGGGLRRLLSREELHATTMAAVLAFPSPWRRGHGGSLRWGHQLVRARGFRGQPGEAGSGAPVDGDLRAPPRTPPIRDPHSRRRFLCGCSLPHGGSCNVGPPASRGVHAYYIFLPGHFSTTRACLIILVWSLSSLSYFSISFYFSFYQAALHVYTSRPVQFSCHRSDSEPPTGSGIGGLLPVGDFSKNIFGSPAKHLLDATLNHFKPTLREALPHQRHHASVTPLQPSAGDLRSGGESGSVSTRDLDVMGSFLKSLHVTLLL